MIILSIIKNCFNKNPTCFDICYQFGNKPIVFPAINDYQDNFSIYLYIVDLHD